MNSSFALLKNESPSREKITKTTFKISSKRTSAVKVDDIPKNNKQAKPVTSTRQKQNQEQNQVFDSNVDFFKTVPPSPEGYIISLCKILTFV